jgi:hypothetical protein
VFEVVGSINFLMGSMNVSYKNSDELNGNIERHCFLHVIIQLVSYITFSTIEVKCKRKICPCA